MDTGVNVCRACFDILDTHVSDAYKTTPAGSLHTVGWNLMMLTNKIVDQLMLTYGKPTPHAVCQNNVTFFSAYNPKDPPELLFKRITDCQEVAIVAKVPYRMEQLIMKVINLFTHVGIYQVNAHMRHCNSRAANCTHRAYHARLDYSITFRHSDFMQSRMQSPF